jgi:hypothetical protein
MMALPRGRLECRPRQLIPAGEKRAGSEVPDWALTLMYQGLPGALCASRTRRHSGGPRSAR